MAQPKHNPQPKEVREATRAASQDCMSVAIQMSKADTGDTANGSLRFFQASTEVCLGELSLLNDAKTVKAVDDIHSSTRYTFSLLAGGKAAELQRMQTR